MRIVVGLSIIAAMAVDLRLKASLHYRTVPHYSYERFLDF